MILRMVIDCGEQQTRDIKRYLDQKHRRDDLFYGTLETDRSLMTCNVDGLGHGEHIHVIDADNGGYAVAAIELKTQMKPSEAL